MSDPMDSVPVEAKDFLGNPIIVNATIVYPVRRKSSMWLKTLVVTAVRSTTNGVRVSGMNESGHHVSIQNIHNCVVVSACLPENHNATT